MLPSWISNPSTRCCARRDRSDAAWISSVRFLPKCWRNASRSPLKPPRGRNAENWRFLIVTDETKKAAIGDLYLRALARLVESRRLEAKATQQALADRLHEMPALILVCAVGRPPAEVSGQVGFYGSILPAAWSLMLALRARGLGTTWTSLHTLFAPEVAEVLGIPDDVTQTILLPVGYMKDAVLRPAERQPPHEVTYWNTWGATRDGSTERAVGAP